MEAELQPYQFLETDYSRKAFTLTNDKMTASYVLMPADGVNGAHCGPFGLFSMPQMQIQLQGQMQVLTRPPGPVNSNVGPYLSMTRPIGRDHRLILKIDGSDVAVSFTTCTTASLMADENHLKKLSPAVHVSGMNATKRASQVSIRRTTDNRIEVVVSDYSGGSNTSFCDVSVAAGVPLVPAIAMCYGKAVKILPDEEGLQIVRSQIDALQVAEQKRHELVTAIVTDWSDLRSAVQSTASKRDQQTEEHDQSARTRASDVVRMKSLSQIREKMQLVLDKVSGGIESDVHQLLYSVRTELSSYKSEVSADNDHKTQVRENKIKDQSERIDELMHQMEQMKVDSPHVACHDVDFSAWLSNDFVSVRDSVIQRIGDIDQKNYIFRVTPFVMGTKITFMISRLSTTFCESLTFGVTVYSAFHLDMQFLPANGLKLKISSKSSFWQVANDFIPTPQEKQIICLIRTSDGVVMQTETEERLLLPVDPFVCVFPFFLFDGSVEAIQLREFKVHNRERMECLICLDKVASTRVKPCGHILYCEDCRSGAITCRIDSNCPLCGDVIIKYKKIRTD